MLTLHCMISGNRPSLFKRDIYVFSWTLQELELFKILWENISLGSLHSLWRMNKKNQKLYYKFSSIHTCVLNYRVVCDFWCWAFMVRPEMHLNYILVFAFTVVLDDDHEVEYCLCDHFLSQFVLLTDWLTWLALFIMIMCCNYCAFVNVGNFIAPSKHPASKQANQPATSQIPLHSLGRVIFSYVCKIEINHFNSKSSLTLFFFFF